jgi:hypothetical protein
VVTARWTLLRAAIATTIEGLTPETEPNVLYREARDDSVLQGASARRCFWQDPPAVTWILQQGDASIRGRYEWVLNLVLHRNKVSIPAFTDATATEPLNVMRALLVMPPTTGADAVLVPSYASTTLGDADEVHVQFRLQCEVDEVL